MKLQHTDLHGIGDFAILDNDSIVTVLHNTDGTTKVVAGIIQTAPAPLATKVEYKGKYFIDFTGDGNLDVSGSSLITTMSEINTIVAASEEIPNIDNNSFTVSLIVADTNNGNAGYRKDMVTSSISPAILGITYIGSYFNEFIISMPKQLRNIDSLSVVLFDEDNPIELIWSNEYNAYSSTVEYIKEDMNSAIGHTITITIKV